MRPSPAAVGLLALIFGSGSAAAFQEPSLGEIAKREKKRRKAAAATGTTARTITESDLKGGPPAPDASAPQPESEAKPAARPGATPEKSEEDLRAERRAELEKKIDEQRERMDKVRELMAGAQTELNDLSNQTIGGRRASLLKLIQDGQNELAACEQRIAELEDEARRAGMKVGFQRRDEPVAGPMGAPSQTALLRPQTPGSR